MTSVDFTLSEKPYNHDGESLDLAVSEIKLDDGDPEPVSGTEISVVGEDDWDYIDIDLGVSVAEETLDHVFPDKDDHNGALVFTTYCPKTHERSAEAVGTNTISPGDYTGQIRLLRESYRERVEIQAKLIRNGHRSATDEYATDAGRELAVSETIDFYLDPPSLGLEGDLPVDAAKFSDRPDLGQEGNQWYVDLRDPETPKLWVNKDHPYIVDVLNSVESQKNRGKVGRVVLNHLAVPMLTQFTIKAAQQAVVKGEVEYEWQTLLLTDVCGEYFDYEDEIDIGELEDALSVEAIPDTLNGIDQIVQRRRTPHTDVQALLRVMGDD